MITIENYTITGELYKGKRTIVYKGYSLKEDTPVILKTIQGEHFFPEDIARLRHEYEITKDLDIKGIVRPYGLQKYGNGLVLVLEDFGGISLKKIINSHGIETDVFLNIAIQVVNTLSALHRHRIVHKDIKPSNIIYNPENRQVKITDFGISTILSREYQTAVNPNILEGSLFYLSPEQTGRMNRAIDYRTDFYSLGVTFYEILTGRLPFLANDPIEWIHCHIAKKPAPPHTVNAKIPSVLSMIIMKLLSKTAEERYQSAYGLKMDLEKCRHLLSTNALATAFSPGTLECFVPGENDRPETLQIPQKLYGRDTDLATLMDAFNRASEGAAEMMLVSGYSGIGKSSLVGEIHKPVVRQRGYFAAGKFDQFQRNIPYACLIQAFRELVRQLLTESKEKITHWKDKLLSALGTNGQVVVNVIHEVELIIEKQPEMQELPPAESQNRFNMVFRNFARVFAQKDHPLVLFLDDLQWADSASLKLIQLLTTDPDTQHLLIIGAYRDNEVSGTHPLLLTLDAIRKTGITVNHIYLSQFDTDCVNQLISDTLKCKKEDSLALANLVTGKTAGNPFFVNEFLKKLYHDTLLTFDADTGTWLWDTCRIENVGITENVVELMAARIRELSENTQDVLKIAACIGNEFDLRTLSIVCEKSNREIAAELWVALQEGLIIAESSFRIEDCEVLYYNPDCKEENQGRNSARFKFLHDRVQQATYSLIDEDQKKNTHLKIGRLILRNINPEEKDEKIFNIVNQLNYGKELISQSGERIALANLNLTAGRKAKISTAYEPALKYLTVGMQLLDEHNWQTMYELTTALYRERAECEYLCGNFNEAEGLFDILLKRVITNPEKADIYTTKIVQYTNQGRYKEAIAIGREGLKLFHVSLPDKPGKIAIMQEYLKSRWHCFKRKREGKKNISDLFTLPVMSNQDSLAAMKILKELPAPSYFLNMDMFAFVNLKMVNLSLKYGNTDVSPFAYSTYGMILGGVFGNYESGYKFGELALKLNEKFNNNAIKNKPPFAFYTFINHWKRHTKEDIDSLAKVYQASLDCGDLIYAGYTLVITIMKIAVSGCNLNDVLTKANTFLDFVSRIKDQNSAHYINIIKQMALCLKGSTTTPAGFTDNDYNEEEQVALMRKNNDIVPLHWYYIFKSQVLYIAGDYAGAVRMAIESDKILKVSLGQLYLADHYFYYSLALTAHYPAATRKEKKGYRKILKRNQGKLKKWANHCPENFSHKYLLVSAEIARLGGKEHKALELYDHAIQSARENEYTQNEAIAQELLAWFCLQRGYDTLTRNHMQGAYYGYLRWGADAKAKALKEKHPGLVAKVFVTENDPDITTRTHTTSRGSELLDITSVIKVSQVISGEINLDKLLEKLMQIVIENAGARRGILMLERGGKFYLEAEGSADNGRPVVLQSVPVENCDTFSLSIVNYVTRTHEDVTLGNAAEEGMFTGDEYIVNTAQKSILCTPVINQGKLTGILYLENNLATRVFTPKRSELLKILSAQLAISIENAYLYKDLKESHEQLEDYSRTLEKRVDERTSELSKSNELLMQEIAERKQIEKELDGARESAIAANLAKTEFLASMSHEIRTPLNAITGMADLLWDTQLTQEQRKYVRIFQSAGENLLEIINDILDLSKVESGQIELENIAFDLHELVENICEIMAVRAHKKGLELNCHMAQDVPAFFLGDPVRLRQIFINLIGNAIKFTEKGEIVLKVVNDPNSKKADTLIFSVSDTGIGIPEEKLQIIFERFAQVDSSTTRKYGGTGLGLAISKKLVELMCGQIRVESKVDHGSTFYFTAKLRVQAEQQAQEETQAINLNGVKVLILDDNDTNRLILKEMLSGWGAIVSEASCGEQALEMLKNANIADTPFWVLLLDCRMPGMDGFQVAENIKNDPELHGITVMMLTSDNRNSDSARAKKLGITSYIVKPVKRNELLNTISLAVRKTQTLTQEPTTEDLPGNREDIDLLNILLVEDYVYNRIVVLSYLKNNANVDIAENGKIGVEKFKSKKYDIVLMDLQMPVMDGYTATSEIRRYERAHGIHPTPVIALTAHALKEETQKSLNAGCDECLTKPIKKKTLVETIRRYTATKKPVSKTEELEDSHIDVDDDAGAGQSGRNVVTVIHDFKEIVPSFLDRVRKDIIIMTEALQGNDYETIMEISHRIKGAGGGYGFDRISELAMIIEACAKERHSEKIQIQLKEFSNYMETLQVVYGKN